MPRGLERQRENKTAFSRRTLTINWQVEWFIFENKSDPTKVMRKALDEVPLNQAITEALRWDRVPIRTVRRSRTRKTSPGDEEMEHLKKKRKPPGKKHRGGQSAKDFVQDITSFVWPSSDYTIQSSITGVWDQVSDTASVPLTIPEQSAEMARWKFFLLKAGEGVNEKALIPISSTETLSTALSGRTVVEFPTIYVLSPSAELPEGFALDTAERRKRKAADPPGGAEGAGRPPKRRQVQQEVAGGNLPAGNLLGPGGNLAPQ